MLNDNQIKSFYDNGFIHIKNFFSKDFINSLRKYLLDKYIDEKSNYHASGSDLLSDELLSKIILDDKLISSIQSILGKKIVYFGESCWNCSSGKTTPMAYHTDNSDRNSHGKDWEIENYPIVRFAFYLQDHVNQGGGPLIGLQTHKKFIQNMYLRVLYRETVGPLTGKFIHVPCEIGDLLIWNLRTTHAGDGLKFKHINFPISKRLSKFIPEFLISRCKEKRFLINGNFGLESDELTKYITYLKTRSYQIERWNNMNISEKKLIELNSKGVKFLNFQDEIKIKIKNGKINLNQLHKDHVDYKV
tara:strand:+ start:589 stop:1497 length:909 start_codon:yes stop_codon:yes gene_type:complete